MKNTIKMTLLAALTIAISCCSMLNSKKNTPTISKSLVWYNFTNGYSKAKAESKILLVDVYTDWCGWCKVMDKKTYTDSTVIANLNKSYICVKLNPEQDSVYVMEGNQLSALDVKNFLSDNRQDGYPSTYFMKPIKSKAVLTVSGYIEPVQFNTYLTKDVPAKFQ